MSAKRRKKYPCAECGGRVVPMGLKMPDGRVIPGEVCLRCGSSHNANGPS